MGLSGIVDVLEQALARKLVTTTHEVRETPVADRDLVIGAALAGKAQHQLSIADKVHMAVAQRGQSVTVIVSCVLGIADTQPRRVEQADDDREHLISRHALTRDVASQAAAEPRECFGKGRHALELLAIADETPVRVIAVLLASARVAARRLQLPA